MSGKSKTKDKAKSQAQEIPTSTEVVSTPEQIIEPEPIQEPAPTSTPEPEEPTPEPEPVPTPTPTLEQLYKEIQILKQLSLEHSGMIVHLQEALARKRKPVASNSKIQIRDKHTNVTYPSKNNCYQSLLKAGELKSLVDKGLFGDVPEKNTFGWYVLVREWPDRFEEIHEVQNSK